MYLGIYEGSLSAGNTADKSSSVLLSAGPNVFSSSVVVAGQHRKLPLDERGKIIDKL